MQTNCEICTAEIEDYEVNRCPVCGADGMCGDCLISHKDEDGNPCDGVERKGDHRGTTS